MNNDLLRIGDEGYCAGAWNEVLFSVHRTQATLERMIQLRRCFQTLIARMPAGKIASLTVIEPSSSAATMPAPVREESARLIREVAPALMAAATVVEGSGFLAATGRLVISGVYMLSRQTFPTKVHTAVDEGARWLLPLIGRKSERDFDSLAAAIAAARGGLRPQSGAARR